jgi:hypothetical protein
LTVMDIITLVIAIIGAVLGIINTWRSLDKDRVKLKVIPKSSQFVGLGQSMVQSSSLRVFVDSQLGIEIINLSSFPVTISEVGLLYRGSKIRGALAKPIVHDGGAFPRRLESRSSFTVFFGVGEPKRDQNFINVKHAYAGTDCGTLVKCNGHFFTKANIDALLNA